MEAFQGIIFDSHDPYFRSPQGAIPQGEDLKLRIFVSKALAPYGVTLRLWDNGCERLLNMTCTNYFDHTPYGDFLEEYTVNVSCETLGLLWYCFIVNTPGKPLYCLNDQLLTGGRGQILNYLDLRFSFQITVIKKDFKTPDWAKGAIMYQIFPDRFFKGQGSAVTDKRMHEGWEEEPEYMIDADLGYYPANDFFGGSLKGIEEKLDHIKSLNVDIIYLNPIFEAYSNHRYDTGDYEKVDSLLGTEEDLIHLVSAAREKGIRIILDGVFSHTGSNSKYFNREGTYSTVGAYQGTESPFYDWYDFEEFPDKYDCWWGVWSLPCVKEMTPSYVKYILTDENSIVKRWLRTGISGWRLDVADELPDEFLKLLRTAVKEENGDALILGEVWEDASNKVSYGVQREFLWGEELDSVMNYPLKNAVVDYLLEKIDGEGFKRRVLSLRENYPKESFLCLMNFLSTHDSERILTRFVSSSENMSREEQALFVPDAASLIKAKACVKLASLMIFTLPGMPSVYYGDEAGLQGMKDPFNRKPYPWGREDGELLGWYRSISALRDKVFRKGELFIDTAGSLLSIRRSLEGEWRYVLINPADDTVETLLDGSYFKGEPSLILDTGLGVQFSPRENGYYLLLPPRSGVVLK
jgi:4-alpha-glucanotransferase